MLFVCSSRLQIAMGREMWPLRKRTPKARFSTHEQFFLNTIRYDTIRYDGGYLRAPKSQRIASLICRTEPNKQTNEETENKKRDAQKKRSSHKAVESVLRLEGSLWWERFAVDAHPQDIRANDEQLLSKETLPIRRSTLQIVLGTGIYIG